MYTMSYGYNAILIQNKLIVVEKYHSFTDSYRQVYKYVQYIYMYVPNYVYAQWEIVFIHYTCITKIMLVYSYMMKVDRPFANIAL